MFYYYGRKARIANLYPSPRYGKIIEPFAGSAAYSLYGDRWKNQVFLYDINPIVVCAWNYLINDATKETILALPDFNKGDDIRNSKYLSDAERIIIGFAINPGSASPRNIATNFSRWKANKKYISDNIHKIKHWKIQQLSYLEIENSISTWFIDPPYEVQGIHYVSGNSIDRSLFADLVKRRDGLTIACENMGANYLPFSRLAEIKSAGKKRSVESVYIKDSTSCRTS